VSQPAEELLVRGAAEPAEDGCLVRVTPASAGWRYVGFEAFRLARGRLLERPTADREVCAVLLAGVADVSFAGREWPEIGRRASVFDGIPPYAVHAPPGGTLTVRAVSDTVELALCWAPATAGVAPVLITPEDCRVSSRGEGVTERRIHDVLMEDRPAEALLITEVLTPAGHWSSYPPHKHDTDDEPRETCLEETYYHRLRRPGGFALQTVYTADRSLEAALRVRDGDVALVPRGYHPVAAEPTSDLYYLNVMAGPRRRWLVTVDPDHGV
jgi:5-deoxy-glucuronate isomerase